MVRLVGEGYDGSGVRHRLGVHFVHPVGLLLHEERRLPHHHDHDRHECVGVHDRLVDERQLVGWRMLAGVPACWSQKDRDVLVRAPELAQVLRSYVR